MALILQEYTVKNPIFVFLTSLTDFSDRLLSASASCYFSNLLWLFILFHLFGDPKMGYNRCPLFIKLTEQRFCAVSFIKINQN
jgi:hypothetical protein